MFPVGSADIAEHPGKDAEAGCQAEQGATASAEPDSTQEEDGTWEDEEQGRDALFLWTAPLRDGTQREQEEGREKQEMRRIDIGVQKVTVGACLPQFI